MWSVFEVVQRLFAIGCAHYMIKAPADVAHSKAHFLLYIHPESRFVIVCAFTRICICICSASALTRRPFLQVPLRRTYFFQKQYLPDMWHAAGLRPGAGSAVSLGAGR